MAASSSGARTMPPIGPERTVEDLACFVKRYALEKNQGGFSFVNAADDDVRFTPR